MPARLFPARFIIPVLGLATTTTTATNRLVQWRDKDNFGCVVADQKLLSWYASTDLIQNHGLGINKTDSGTLISTMNHQELIGSSVRDSTLLTARDTHWYTNESFSILFRGPGIIVANL